MEKIYTCKEIAERYSVNVNTVWDWVRTNKIPAINIGKGYRIAESDLVKFEEDNRTVRE